MLVTPQDFDEVVQSLAQKRELGFDTETTGVEWGDKLFSIIIASDEEVFYFNFQKYPYHTPLPRGYIQKLQPIFNPETLFYVSNAKFDMHMIQKDGLRPTGRWFCTNAQGRVRKNNLMAYGLDASAKLLLGRDKDDRVGKYIDEKGLFSKEKIFEYAGEIEYTTKKRFWEVPLEIIQPYAEKDARLHYELGRKIREDICALTNPFGESVANIMENELALTGVCQSMEHIGVRVDVAYVRKAANYEQIKLEALLGQYKYIASKPFVDHYASLHKTFVEQGYTDFVKTDKGNPSFKSEILEAMPGDLPHIILGIREHQKRISTYYLNFLYYMDENGVIHPDMKQGGTETGRFSYANPNLQNLPKEEDAADDSPSIVRRSFIPREGMFFVMIDYSQQEYRMMLDYAGEKKIIADVMAGADVHQAMADLVGIKRSEAKTLNFAILYGAGPAKIAQSLKIPLWQAKELLRRYEQRLPKVMQFKDQVIQKGKSRGYVINWAGRRCHIAKAEWAYILPNHLIQGGGADVIKFAMVRIAKLLDGKKSRMLLQIHDELLFEFAPEEAHLIQEIRDIMENVYTSQNGMKLTTSVEYSFKSWGQPDKIKGLPYTGIDEGKLSLGASISKVGVS